MDYNNKDQKPNLDNLPNQDLPPKIVSRRPKSYQPKPTSKIG